MTSSPPPRPPAAGPPEPKDPADAWVYAPSGEKYWGLFGAAGLLAVDPARGVLMQHRVEWSHHGGTWGIPGGAVHEHESAVAGALREACEEAAAPADALRVRFTSVVDLGVWSYTSVIADVVRPFDASITDAESVALEWVARDAVADLPLHPGFAASWPGLLALLDVRASLVVDAANVVGSVPDGWWRDRAGAAARLGERLSGLEVPAANIGLNGTTWFPEVALVVEGAARAASVAARDVSVVRAPGHGDDAILAEAVRRMDAGQHVTVVTSDRGLRERVVAAGAAVMSAGALRRVLDGAG